MIEEKVEETSKVEKRKIILRDGYGNRSRSFGTKAVVAEVGKPITVDEVTARLAIESGEFEYTDFETLPVPVEGALPESFPLRDELSKSTKPILTLSALNSATDDEILLVDGIGPKTLQKIREAAAELNGE